MSESKAVAKADDTPKGIRGLMLHDSVKTAIEPLLPEGVTYDRVVSAAYFAARQNPQITECTTASIVDAVSRIIQWGLDIGLTAHLVPFGKICTPIADYKGIAELMRRSGAVRHVETHVVYKGDRFEYQYGTNAYLHHQPTAIAKERGEITHAYVILRLPYNHSSFEVMSIEDIDAIRQKYSRQWKSGACPAWYAKKTVLKQAAKLIPKDHRLAAVLEVVREDEDGEFENPPEVLPSGSVAALRAGAQDEEYADTLTRKRVEMPMITDPDDPRYYDRLDGE